MREVCFCRLFAVVIAVAGAPSCGGGAGPASAPSAPATTAGPTAAQEGAAPQPESALEPDAARDAARERGAVREQDLTSGSVRPDPTLVHEIINLDRLLAATPRSAADRNKGWGYAALPSAANLAKAARRDITSIYASAGDPEKAFNFLRP